MRNSGRVATALVLALPLGCGGGQRESRAEDRPAPARPRDPSRAVVTARDAPVPEATDPRERLVYLRAGSVWIMEPDGSEATQLTVRAESAPDRAPALSPDGGAVAYASPKDGVYRIMVMSLEDMIPRAITDGGSGDGGSGRGDTAPAWSPDGRRIAFVRGDPRVRRDLYLVDAAGGTPELLLKGNDDEPEHVGAPVFSPDGAALVFSADRRRGNGTLLWRLDLESGTLSRTTPIEHKAWYIADLDPSFSPDGTRIAFASNRHVASGDDAGDFDIYGIAPDGSGLMRLTSDPGVARDPAYSPDGERIFFTSSRERENSWEREIYVMASGGGEQRRLTRDERPQNRAPSAGLAK